MVVAQIPIEQSRSRRFLSKPQPGGRGLQGVVGGDAGQRHLVQAQMRDDDPGEIPELLALLGREGARLGIEHAQAAEADAGPHDERSTRVEPNAVSAGDERALAHAHVLQRILDDEHLVGEDRVSAERRPTRRAVSVEAAPGLEPLALLIDEGDQGDRQAEHYLGIAADGVEVLLGRRTEDVERAHGLQALGLVGRHGIHGGCSRSRDVVSTLARQPAGDA